MAIILWGPDDRSHGKCHRRCLLSRGMTEGKRRRARSHLPQIKDEPAMEERFQRALRKALNTPPQHRLAPIPKPKARPASKGRVHKGKTKS